LNVYIGLANMDSKFVPSSYRRLRSDGRRGLNAVVVLWFCYVSLPIGKAVFGQANDGRAQNVFRATPRAVNLQASRVRAADQQRQFAEATFALSELLRELGDEDYFVSEPGSRIAQGFRFGLERLVSELHPEILIHFERLHGAEAQKQLDDSIATRSLTGLQQCARRWQFTEAGRRAALLLARIDLHRDRPALAIRRLTGLRSAAAQSRLEPERSLLLATALHRQGQMIEAVAVLETL
jgi:hypothetical protein